MHYRGRSPSMSMGAFVGLCALIIIPFCYVKFSAVTGSNVRSAESELKIWAGKLDIEIDGSHISCNSDDSDGDGYVSCSYKDKAGQVHQVECAGAFNFQHGCRVPKPNLKVTQINTDSSRR
jgi:hypothetical protein